MLKALSVIGYPAMAGGVVGLLFAHRLFSPSPVVPLPQGAAVGNNLVPAICRINP